VSLKRREFIRKAAGSVPALAFAGMVGSAPYISAMQQLQGATGEGKRVAVLFDSTLQAVDGIDFTRKVLEDAFGVYRASWLNADDLKSKLNVREFDLFVNPYGSAFPLDGYPAILQYLRDGGNWLNLGGTPFGAPVTHDGTSVLRTEEAQPEYHKRIGITQSFAVEGARIKNFTANMEFETAPDVVGQFSAETIFEFYVKFSTTTDLPNESGSAGARDAVLFPLVWGEDERGIRIAAPMLIIDRTQGEFAGGRWVFANFKGTITGKCVRHLAAIALQGVSEFRIENTFACYRKGEIPSFTAIFRRPNGDAADFAPQCELEIWNDAAKVLQKIPVRWNKDAMYLTGSASMAESIASGLVPGLYRVHAKTGNSNFSVRYATAFWVYDEKLLAAGTALSVDKSDKQFLQRHGNPYPITGTTYMASDVQRKFLFEPNPKVWDEDFKQMKESGVNMIRTGIWTGWRSYMLDNGSPNEQALRGLDAFVHTARKYDIPVIFTLFAFVPEMWDGVNPYLDPRAVAAQKQFITAISSRYSTVNDILWDFINEPSFCSPTHLWSCRPNYDSFEYDAWSAWLNEHYQGIPAGERDAKIKEYYRATIDDGLALPTMEDFDDVNIIEGRHPVKTMDYRLFAQEMFAGWVTAMKTAIRSNGNLHQLVTVGQDEAGNGDSPTPHFFGNQIDFTSMHNWWANDDLLWDSVMSKTSHAPNLIEETGVMFYEKIDGRAWRTEEEARNLLERKFAISLGAGGAGFLQWIWNINPFMNSDNEVSIGFYRIDGTAKPELDPFLEYSKFFAANAKHFKDAVVNDVLMVIPQSQMFSTRNLAADATHRCVRVMSYNLGIPVRSVSEYTLSAETERPKLVVFPSPQIFTDDAWKRLRDWVEQGTVLLISGVIDEDEHWLGSVRSRDLNVTCSTKPVAEEEFLSIDGKEYQCSYRGEKIQRVEKAVVDGQKSGAQIVVSIRGKGKIIWSPLPVEMSDSPDPAEALYGFGLRQAGVSPLFEAKGKDPSVLVFHTQFSGATLYAIVSESDRPAELDITDRRSGKSFHASLKAQRSALALIASGDGNILDRLD
jgi:hypothetical protein